MRDPFDCPFTTEEMDGMSNDDWADAVDEEMILQGLDPDNSDDRQEFLDRLDAATAENARRW